MTEASTNHPLNAQLTLDELRADVASGAIDTVVVAITDSLGRLQGKRCGARSFLEDVLDHGAEGCNYLLAVDVEMNTIDGYAMSSWETGYGDMVMLPDVSTLRRVPWQQGTAMVLCDIMWADKSPVVASPRQILRAQVERLEKLGYRAHMGTELEFLMFDDSYREAWQKNYHGLTPPPSTTWTTRCSPRPAWNRSSGPSAPTWKRPAWWSNPPRANATSASRRSRSASMKR